MGSLRGAVCLLGLGLAASAHADEGELRMVAIPLDGPPRAVDHFQLEVAASRAGAPVRSAEPPRLAVRGGTIVGAVEPTAAGRWRAWVTLDGSVLPGEDLRVTVELAGSVVSLPLPTRGGDAPALKVPAGLDGLAGKEGTIRIPISGEGTLDPTQLAVYVGEGLVGEAKASGESLVVEWQTLDDPLPRALPYLVFDSRRPRSIPAMGVASLVGRPRIPIETDPGAQVSVEVGGRTYGPFAADDRGVAVALIDVKPGETSAEVVARDAAGGQQRTRIALGSASPPRMVLASEGALVAGQPIPDLYIAVVRADGQPWKGAAPECQTVVGRPLVVAPLREGLWQAELPAGTESLFDLRVECSLLGQARAVDQIAVDPAVPTAVRLRAFPSVLDADMPLAQVQAWLEGPLGDRLRAEGIELEALRGTLRPEQGSAALVVAAYDGSEAIEAGDDEIIARWEPSVGEGGPWGLGVQPAGLRLADGALPLVVWAYDRRARPLPDEPVVLRVGDVLVETRTDARGRARIDLPVDPSERGPWRVEARTRDVAGGRILFAQDFDDARAVGGLGLVARVPIELHSGDVRRVVVASWPEQVQAGGAQRSTIVVSLLDQAGRAVTSRPPVMRASQGELSEVRLVQEGSFEAELTPPDRLAYGTIRVDIEASEGGWSASTEVEVTPRPLRVAVGPMGGLIIGNRRGLVGFGGLELEFAPGLAPRGVLARVAVGGWSRTTGVEDPRTGEAVQVETSWIPLGVGVLFRQERARLGWYGGAQAYLVPYVQRSSFGDRTQARALGLAGPGLEPLVGIGGRLANTELQLQLGYYWLNMPAADVTYQGSVGGVRPSLGWKFVF